jgi:Sec-independent protein translocase protein TatA
MEFLGIGPFELIIILLIALLVMGPDDMKKAGLTLGRLLRQLITSPTWATLQQMMREVRFLPNRLMREAGMEEEEMRSLQNEIRGSIPRREELHQTIGFEAAQRELNQTRSEFRQWEEDMKAWTSLPDPEPTSPQTEPPAEPDSSTARSEPEDTQP